MNKRVGETEVSVTKIDFIHLPIFYRDWIRGRSDVSPPTRVPRDDSDDDVLTRALA